MKLTIIILIVLSSNLSIAQSQLAIIPCFCDSKEKVSYFDHETQLYRNDSLITDKFYPINDFMVDSLNQGFYTLQYKSIFNQQYSTKFRLTNKKTELKICVDKFQPKNHTNLIDELEQGDTLELWVYSTGCQYYDFGKIQFTKTGDRIKASLVINDEIKHERFLVNSHTSLVREIEQKMWLIKEVEDNGYTTTYHFEIKLNGVNKLNTFYWFEATNYKNSLKKLFKL